MERLMIIFARVILLAICLWFSLVPYARALAYLWQLAPSSHDKWVAVPWLVLTSVLPAALIAGAVCYPIAWAFGRAAPWTALCLSAPVVALRIHDMRPDPKALELVVTVLSCFSYVLFVRTVCRRRDSAGKPTPTGSPNKWRCRKTRMNRFCRSPIAFAALVLAASAYADPLPDPTDFMANMTAFVETCATRYPEMNDTPALLVASMTPDDRKLYDDTRQSPGFAPAMAKARSQWAGVPTEKLLEMCKSMHDGLKKT
jgi:hypothetical protein